MRVLDVVCGTGIVARFAAARLGNTRMMAGIDMNPAMIEVARSAAADRDAHIEWHVGMAGELPFANKSFDIITIQLSYDQPGRYAERMLRGLSAGVWTMHGCSDEEGSELAETVAANMAIPVRAATVGDRITTDSITFIATGTRLAC